MLGFTSNGKGFILPLPFLPQPLCAPVKLSVCRTVLLPTEPSAHAVFSVLYPPVGVPSLHNTVSSTSGYWKSDPEQSHFTRHSSPDFQKGSQVPDVKLSARKMYSAAHAVSILITVPMQTHHPSLHFLKHSYSNEVLRNPHRNVMQQTHFRLTICRDCSKYFTSAS